MSLCVINVMESSMNIYDIMIRDACETANRCWTLNGEGDAHPVHWLAAYRTKKCAELNFFFRWTTTGEKKREKNESLEASVPPLGFLLFHLSWGRCRTVKNRGYFYNVLMFPLWFVIFGGFVALRIFSLANLWLHSRSSFFFFFRWCCSD